MGRADECAGCGRDFGTGGLDALSAERAAHERTRAELTAVRDECERAGVRQRIALNPGETDGPVPAAALVRALAGAASRERARADTLAAEVAALREALGRAVGCDCTCVGPETCDCPCHAALAAAPGERTAADPAADKG